MTEKDIEREVDDKLSIYTGEGTPLERAIFRNQVRRFFIDWIVAAEARADQAKRKRDDQVRMFSADLRRRTEERDRLRRLAKEATNGWASYARTKLEHNEIARLHREIDALTDDAAGQAKGGVAGEHEQGVVDSNASISR